MITIIVVLIEKDNKILILKENGQWQLPGDIKNILEYDHYVIRRILFEKLGIYPLVDKYLRTATFVYKGAVMEIKAYAIPVYMGDIILYDNQQITWIGAQAAESFELCDFDKEILKLL